MPVLRILADLWNDGAGVTAIEYAVITALISIVGLSIYTQISGELSNVFNTVSNSL
jgi:Flp pilus assembly pilin Flp